MIGIARGGIGIEKAITTATTGIGEEHTHHPHLPHERPSQNTPPQIEIEEQIPLLRDGHHRLRGTTARGERVLQREILGIVVVDGRMRGVIGIEALQIVEEGGLGVIDVVTMIEIGQGIGVHLRVVAIGMIVIEIVGDIGGMLGTVGGDLDGTIVIELVVAV